MSNGIAITKENFEGEVLKSPIPVLVDFWATWCGPCKMMAPMLDDIAEEYLGRLKIVKVDVDAQGDLAEQHNVVSVPTLALYKGGQLQTQRTGALPKYEIVNFFKDYI
ncbi:thioredoxin [Treponema primitia ZAS-2]|uniref:Thioredoxin n=1 Tax=Treponema primitia (strain ATCC BAA-887 / DSM 12427 / ZAS-2) TaxID=545694 RepID=F5YIW5_TREPZ|nr:thioredoxin [Treponema primitia]AEF85284.1 thioredoxin [Treponema primitia ZAS-2]